MRLSVAVEVTNGGWLAYAWQVAQMGPGGRLGPTVALPPCNALGSGPANDVLAVLAVRT